jgi:hypothetical protein
VGQDFFHLHGIPTKPKLFFQQCDPQASSGEGQSSFYPVQTTAYHNPIELQVDVLVMMF